MCGFETADEIRFWSETCKGGSSSRRAKCGGNVHGRGAVEMTASSVYGTFSPRNAADLGTKYSYFFSENEPGQCICLDFKTIRIEPMHYTVRTWNGDPNNSHLKSWAVEGSDDGASWTEIDRRENNGDLNDKWAMKTFAVARSGSFRRIRLRQTGPNHSSHNYLVLTAFDVFGAVAGLQ
jgi:hypothetical protein